MPVFYVDLDRTLFRTDRVSELFAAVERLYPDNDIIKGGYDKRAAYYVFAHKEEGDEATYYHDIVAQLHDAGLDHTEVFARLREELGDGRFEYPGAKDFIRALQALGEVKALTYGEDAYQRLKAVLCPSLEGVEVIAIIASKSDYLNRHAHTGDWIIDDKRLHGLTRGVTAVYIQHDPGMPADVHSLAEAKERIIAAIDI